MDRRTFHQTPRSEEKSHRIHYNRYKLYTTDIDFISNDEECKQHSLYQQKGAFFVYLGSAWRPDVNCSFGHGGCAYDSLVVLK